MMMKIKKLAIALSAMTIAMTNAQADTDLKLPEPTIQELAQDVARTKQSLDEAMKPEKIKETKAEIEKALIQAEKELAVEADYRAGVKDAKAPPTLTPEEALSRSEKLMKKWKAGETVLSIEQTERLMKNTPTSTDISDLFKKFSQQAKKQNSDRRLDTESVLLFVSFSMPDNILREYMRQAQEANITLVLRGFYENKTGQHTNFKTQSLAGKNGSPEWLIHPALFEAYKIERVPALVVSSDGAKVKEDGCFSKGDFTAVTGEISIVGGLEKILGDQNSSQSVRKIVLKKLAQYKKNKSASVNQ